MRRKHRKHHRRPHGPRLRRGQPDLNWCRKVPPGQHPVRLRDVRKGRIFMPANEKE